MCMCMWCVCAVVYVYEYAQVCMCVMYACMCRVQVEYKVYRGVQSVRSIGHIDDCKHMWYIYIMEYIVHSL
jgi:hypothetical protein